MLTPLLQSQCFRITQATTQVFQNLYVQNTLLILVKSGSKRVITGTNDSFTVEPGQLLIFPSSKFITIENRRVRGSDYVADCIAYPDNDVETVFPLRRSSATDEPAIHVDHCPHELAELITNIGHARSSDLPDSVVRHKLLEPLVWLQSLGIALAVTRRKPLECRLRDLLVSDLSHRWRIEEVARELGCSESTLRRRLKERDTSYSDILMNVRLEQGLAALHSSKQSISNIALACGFSTPSHFSDAFKTRFSISPSAVRTAQA